MMKKKLKDQQEEKKNNNTKQTDNKENSNIPGSIYGDKPDNSVAGESTEPSPEEPNGVVTAPVKVDSEITTVEEKLAEMQDKYIRLSAEFDNYRKRTLREKMELSKYAGENLLLKIIPLMDDFDRALHIWIQQLILLL